MSGPGEAAKDETPAEAPAPEPMKLVLPPLDNGAKCLYDTEAKAMWIGIPVSLGLDPFAAACFLDAAKLEFLKHYQREAPALAKAAQTRSSLMGKAREGVGAMMARLGGK